MKGPVKIVKTREIIEYLAGNEIVKEMENYIERNFEDFQEVRRNYVNAIEQLENELDHNDLSYSQTLAEAIEQQVASVMLFSGALGVKANLDHFLYPMGKTVLDVDFDVFLNERIAVRLPEYEKAQTVVESYLKKIPPERNDIYEAIIEYVSYIETVGPKLTNYFGFALGDEILFRVVPGYHPDRMLTERYFAVLVNYFGREIERSF